MSSKTVHSINTGVIFTLRNISLDYEYKLYGSKIRSIDKEEQIRMEAFEMWRKMITIS